MQFHSRINNLRAIPLLIFDEILVTSIFFFWALILLLSIGIRPLSHPFTKEKYMQFFFIKIQYSQLNSHIYWFICLCIYFIMLRNENQCFVHTRLGQHSIIELLLRKCIPKWYQNKSSNRHANKNFMSKTRNISIPLQVS